MTGVKLNIFTEIYTPKVYLSENIKYNVEKLKANTMKLFKHTTITAKDN